MGDRMLQDAVQKCRDMGLHSTEDEIRHALAQCDDKLEDAIPLLLADSPQCDSNLLRDYNVISNKPFHEREDSFERDVDMRDTETHPGSEAESDRDSTTVSYSVENLRDMEEGEVEEGGEREMSDIPPRPEGPPPRYEDIVNEEGVEEEPPSPPGMEGPPSPPGMEDGGVTSEEKAPVPQPSVSGAQTTMPSPHTSGAQTTMPSPHTSGAQTTMPSPRTSGVEFPLTHFYELESRVHTEQWSIPYKREESLGVCMLATIKMIHEGKDEEEGWGGRRGGGVGGRMVVKHCAQYMCAVCISVTLLL